jgi:hypothetical protein
LIFCPLMWHTLQFNTAVIQRALWERFQWLTGKGITPNVNKFNYLNSCVFPALTGSLFLNGIIIISVLSFLSLHQISCNYHVSERFKVFTAMKIEVTVFWADATTCTMLLFTFLSYLPKDVLLNYLLL